MGDTSSIAVCIHFLGDKFKSNYNVVAFFNVETAIDFCPFSNSVTWNILVQTVLDLGTLCMLLTGLTNELF